MSANNQTLIKEHEGKFYVFENIQAESWCDEDENGNHENELPISEAQGVFDTRDEAYGFALEITDEEVEYGVQFNRLCKDDGEIKLV